VQEQLLNSIAQEGIDGIKVTVSSSALSLTYEPTPMATAAFSFRSWRQAITPSLSMRGFPAAVCFGPRFAPFHVADMSEPVPFVEQLAPLGTAGRVFDGEGRPAAGVQTEMLRAAEVFRLPSPMARAISSRRAWRPARMSCCRGRWCPVRAPMSSTA
jgi:hypothetical protein